MKKAKKVLHVISLGIVGAFVIMTMWIPGAANFYNWLCFLGVDKTEGDSQ